MSEITIEQHLVRVCAKNGAGCLKSEPICAGFPDRMVLAPHGRVMFVETKAPGGITKGNQLMIHDRLRRLGFQVEVPWSKEDVDRWAAGFFGGV